MDYYCDVCDKFIKAKSNYKYFKTNIYKEVERCKNKELAIENPNMNDIDEILCAYIIELSKKYDYYVIKCHSKFVFNDNQYSTYIRSNLFDNKTMLSGKNFFLKGN